MPLRFDPSSYFQAYSQGQENEQADRDRFFNSLSGISQGLLQHRQMDAAAKRQAVLDQYLRDKEDRDKRQFESDYGTPIDPNISIAEPTGQVAKSSMMPGGQGKVGRGMPLVEAFNQWRAGGMKKESARPEFMPALGKDERKIFQESMNPNTRSLSYQAKEYLDEKGRARIGRFNPSTGFIEKSPMDEYAPQTARGETAGNLRKEFIDRPEVKDYQLINTQVKSMDSLFTRATQGDLQSKNFLDQALISIFNKINDPSSVIRESEYARTPEGLALANRIQGSISKLAEGGAGLTDLDRRDLVTAAKIIANERGGTYSQTRSGYVNLAQQMSLDPSLITATMPEFSPYQLQPIENSPAQTGWDAAKEQRYQQWKASQVSR